MTFSLTACCPRTGNVGVAVTTSSIAVGARCPWVVAGLGAVSTQNVTDPMLGPQLLEKLAEGAAPDQALNDFVETSPHIAHRQLAIVDVAGRTAFYSGTETLGCHAGAMADGVVAVGNLLDNEGVPQAMIDAYLESTETDLADRLLFGLQAGLSAGGEAGDLHSACLMVARRQNWPEVNLRIDWTDGAPLPELAALWQAYRLQEQDYVTRALNPTAAPSFGVPGDR